MTRQTNADNLSDAIKNLGGKPKKGRPTTADLLDQIENLVSGGDVEQSVADAIERQLPAAIADALSDIGTGEITDTDMDDIFGD